MTDTSSNDFRWDDVIVLGGFIAGNLFYSITKKSLSVALPLIKSSLLASNVDIGAISSKFSLSYGCSKLLGGVLSDIFPPSLLFNVGLFLGAALNIGILLVSDAPSIGILWMLNGMGQGIGGPALSKLVVTHFPSSVSSSVWSYLTFTCNLGYLLSPAFLTPSLNVWGWKGPFLLSGVSGMIVVTIMGSICLSLLRPLHCCNAPDHLHSGSSAATSKAASGHNSSSYSTTGSHSSSDSSSSSSSSSMSADRNHRMANNNQQRDALISELPKRAVGGKWSIHTRVFACLALVLANMFTYFVLKGMHEWTGLFLIEHLQLAAPRVQIWELMLWNEIGGIAGSVSVGWCAEYLARVLAVSVSVSAIATSSSTTATRLTPCEKDAMNGTITTASTHSHESSTTDPNAQDANCLLVKKRLFAGGKSLAGSLFMLVCILGLWGVSLHNAPLLLDANTHRREGIVVSSREYHNSNCICSQDTSNGYEPPSQSQCVNGELLEQHGEIPVVMALNNINNKNNNDIDIDSLPLSSENVCTSTAESSYAGDHTQGDGGEGGEGGEAVTLSQVCASSMLWYSAEYFLPTSSVRGLMYLIYKAPSMDIEVDVAMNSAVDNHLATVHEDHTLERKSKRKEEEKEPINCIDDVNKFSALCTFILFVVNDISQRLFMYWRLFRDRLVPLLQSVNIFVHVPLNLTTLRFALFLAGFGINGPKTLVALDLMELVPRRIAGSFMGAVGLLSQVGASYAGTFLARVVEQQGWCGFLPLLTAASMLLSGLLGVISAIHPAGKLVSSTSKGTGTSK